MDLIDQSSKPALSVSLIDVKGALSNFSSPEPVINVTVRLDTRGHLATSNAVLFSNATEAEAGGVAGALKGLFGGKKDKAETTEEEAETETASASASASSKASVAKKEKIAIKFKEKVLGVKAMTAEEKRTTQARWVHAHQGHRGRH